MSQSGAQHSPVELLTIGDFDPQSDRAIEFDFVGRVIAGRYTVRAHVGGGGMADMFQATDEQLGIDVAIKLLKPRIASDELRARMVQEARAAAQIRHSNLVRVFGTGALDRTAFIVMEWLEGPNLDQYLRDYPDGRMPCHEALELLLPALEALHEIHERGYVHRDIKAGNILVSLVPGHRPTAIVIDLGLIK
jgi:eukaryotic-like serine/threonine-protein kinase